MPASQSWDEPRSADRGSRSASKASETELNIIAYRGHIHAPPACDGPSRPKQYYRSINGTKLTGSSFSSRMAPDASLVSRNSHWTWLTSPTGITIRPPGLSCAMSADGTLAAAAVTMIASKGARSAQPDRPSHSRATTLV